MTVRVIYIWKDRLDGVYWFSPVYTQASPPVPGHRIVFYPDDVAPDDKQNALVADDPYCWLIPECAIDYEAEITLEPGFLDAIHEWRAWMQNHGFSKHPRHEYAELFGVPELAERFPAPPITE
jgi:hypothetical protein